MSYRDEQEALLAYFAYSGGRSLSPAAQEAFHAGWEAQAYLAAEEVQKLEAERRELVEAAYREGYEDGETVKGGVDKCWDHSDAQYALAKIDAQRGEE